MLIPHLVRHKLAQSFLVVLSCLGYTHVQAQQPESLMGFIQISGAKYLDKRTFPIEKPYSLTFVHSYLEFDVEKVPAGGVGAFGAFDSGEVKLLAHVAYAPNITEALYVRELFPPGEWIEPAETPRFVMICGWPQEDGAPPAEVYRTYAERDDGRTMITDDAPYYTRLFMVWRSVSQKRAQAQFQGQDYCQELAMTRQSSAPLWLPATTYP